MKLEGFLPRNAPRELVEAVTVASFLVTEDPFWGSVSGTRAFLYNAVTILRAAPTAVLKPGVRGGISKAELGRRMCEVITYFNAIKDCTGTTDTIYHAVYAAAKAATAARDAATVVPATAVTP